MIHIRATGLCFAKAKGPSAVVRADGLPQRVVVPALTLIYRTGSILFKGKCYPGMVVNTCNLTLKKMPVEVRESQVLGQSML